MVGECLRIVPHGLYTDVEVRYLLHNGSDRDYDDIDCGFPVDCMGEGGYRYVDCDDMSERRQAYGWRDDCIRRVMFAANGVSLPCAASGGTTVKPAAKYVMREFLEEDEAALSDSTLIARYGDDIVGCIPCESRRCFYTCFFDRRRRIRRAVGALFDSQSAHGGSRGYQFSVRTVGQRALVAVRLRSGGALGRRHGRHALRGAGHVGIVPDGRYRRNGFVFWPAFAARRPRAEMLRFGFPFRRRREIRGRLGFRRLASSRTLRAACR